MLEELCTAPSSLAASIDLCVQVRPPSFVSSSVSRVPSKKPACAAGPSAMNVQISLKNAQPGCQGQQPRQFDISGTTEKVQTTTTVALGSG